MRFAGAQVSMRSVPRRLAEPAAAVQAAAAGLAAAAGEGA
jgi:hypothetical protein